MAVGTEVVAVRYENIVADTPISVPYPVYEALDIFVYYGVESLQAVYSTDYTISLADDFDTFTLTPTASLIAKIDALIAADPTEENFITVRRRLDYLTDSTAAAVRYTPFTSREFERTALRFQQIQEQLNRSLTLTPGFVGAVALTLPAPSQGRALVWNATENGLENGPTADEVANAEAYAEAALASQNAAATSETNASTSAGAAATSETNAATSETNAQTAAEAAEQALEDFLAAGAAGGKFEAVANRAAAKALDPTIKTVVLIRDEGGRNGIFVARAGSQPKSDPAEGVYFPSNTAGYYFERYGTGMKFDVRWFGAVLDNSTDDTSAFQACITFASSFTGTPYSPVAEVYCPPGYLFKTTSQLNLTVPLKLNIRSLNIYHNTTGIAWFFHENLPVGYNGPWDVDLEGVLASPGVGGFPAGPNTGGNIGIAIRSMTFSRFKCQQIQGFSHKAVELDGRGISYGVPGGGGQVIQHNDFHFGQIVNNAVGIWAFSLDAATSSVQANRFFIQNIYQNWCNIITGDATYHATTSNTWDINAMDNCTAVGIDSFSMYDRFYVGFAGAPGTTLRRNPQSDYNHYEFNNNLSTDIVLNEGGGGKHDTLRCKPPNNLPANGVTVTNGADYTNTYGCPISVTVPMTGTGTYQMIITNPQGGAYAISAVAAGGYAAFPTLQHGWKWKVFTTSGSITYGGALILAA